MRKLVRICLLWLVLTMMVTSCSVERGVDASPSYDGPVEPVEMPEPIPSGGINHVEMLEPDWNGVPPVDMPEPSLVLELTPEDVLELDKPQRLEFTPAYTEEELIQVAKLLYQEARGIPSDTQVACVAWIVCNRVDGGYGDTISQIWGYPQLWYNENDPVTDRMYRIAKDVLDRWSIEREYGECDGRVLPPDYFWYTGDGVENYFRNVFNDYDNVWDYSLPSPYDS